MSTTGLFGQVPFPCWRSRLLSGLAGRLLTPPAGRAANRLYVFFDPADPASGIFLNGLCPRLMDRSGIEQFWAPVRRAPRAGEGAMASVAGRGASGGAVRPEEGPPAGLGPWEYMDWPETAAIRDCDPPGPPAIANSVALARLAGSLEGRGHPVLVWLEEGELKCLFGVTRASALAQRVPGMRRGPLPPPGGDPVRRRNARVPARARMPRKYPDARAGDDAYLAWRFPQIPDAAAGPSFREEPPADA